MYFALLPLLIAAGCCHCGSTPEAVYPPTTIRFSEGGGVTGRFLGYTIDPEGNVSTWNGFAASVKEKAELATLDADAHAALLRELYACDPSALQFSETGNMTTVLEVSSGELQYRFSWSGLMQDSASAPEALRKFTELLSSTIQSLRQKE